MANKTRTRKSRRRANAVLRHGKSAVRKHQTLSGRKGSAHFKKRGSGRGEEQEVE